MYALQGLNNIGIPRPLCPDLQKMIYPSLLSRRCSCRTPSRQGFYTLVHVWSVPEYDDRTQGQGNPVQSLLLSVILRKFYSCIHKSESKSRISCLNPRRPSSHGSSLSAASHGPSHFPHNRQPHAAPHPPTSSDHQTTLLQLQSTALTR